MERGLKVTLYDIENYGLIEFWNSKESARERLWVPMRALDSYLRGVCMIEVDGGFARSNASTEYTKVGKVQKHEVYDIYAACIGTNGNVWYLIIVNGEWDWISAGSVK